jgi:hypothetical protein
MKRLADEGCESAGSKIERKGIDKPECRKEKRLARVILTVGRVELTRRIHIR